MKLFPSQPVVYKSDVSGSETKQKLHKNLGAIDKTQLHQEEEKSVPTLYCGKIIRYVQQKKITLFGSKEWGATANTNAHCALVFTHLWNIGLHIFCLNHAMNYFW